MLASAGQTAKTIGLTFFEETHGYPGVKKFKIFLIEFFFSSKINLKKIRFQGQYRAPKLVINERLIIIP